MPHRREDYEPLAYLLTRRNNPEEKEVMMDYLTVDTSVFRGSFQEFKVWKKIQDKKELIYG